LGASGRTVRHARGEESLQAVATRYAASRYPKPAAIVILSEFKGVSYLYHRLGPHHAAVDSLGEEG
jgi:hypothetical protein